MIQLSVIVPYYNVAAYIERCVRSLMTQTQNEGLEFIFVNDGSTDNSLDILQQTIADYSSPRVQVKMISLNKHEGVGAARRHGMEAAEGEYLIHCDADDWVEPSIYQQFCVLISQTHADILVCPFFHELYSCRYVEDYRELPITACFIDQRWWSLCTHAVRRSLIEYNDIYPIESITFWEDLDLLMRVFVHAKTIAYLKDPLYHYDRQREQSAVHQNKGTIGFIQCNKVIDHLTSYFQCYAPQHLSALQLLKRAARDLYLEGSNPDYQAWSRTYPETWPLIWENRQLSFAYRLCYLLGSYHLTWPMRVLHSIVSLLC